jgi:hypothetical protein
MGSTARKTRSLRLVRVPHVAASHHHCDNMVRKLKYHEQKLLKKVDFLNVGVILCEYSAFLLIVVNSGNKMQISEKSRLCVGTTSSIETTTTSTTSSVVLYASLHTEFRFCHLRILSGHDGSPAFVKTLRHRCLEFRRKTQRSRKQAHRCSLLQKASGSLYVHV